MHLISEIEAPHCVQVADGTRFDPVARSEVMRPVIGQLGTPVEGDPCAAPMAIICPARKPIIQSARQHLVHGVMTAARAAVGRWRRSAQNPL